MVNFTRIIWCVAALVAVWCLWTLETERAAIPTTTVETNAGPITLYGDPAAPTVVITHGFAGSTQMMQVISYDLVRAGFAVAAFDFAGHGRSRDLLSRDVTRIEGTTEQLVQQTVAVVEALEPEQPIALLGHSMATDIVIRAAERLDGVAAIIAISMYSDAVTKQSPDRLLIISGEWESRLREVALDAVLQVSPTVVEGETVSQDGVTRRAAYAPKVEHVGVLYSTTTLREIRDWLAPALDHAPQGEVRGNGPLILLLLAAIVLGSGAVARLLPQRAEIPKPMRIWPFLVVLLLPVLPAMGTAVGVGGGLLGMAAFGHLLAFFATYALVALIMLHRFGRLSFQVNGAGTVLLLGMCLAFALALDRYGAAFLPVGPRLGLMGVLLVGTVPFLIADRLLVAGARLWQRGLARVVPLSALFALMILWPEEFGLLFTVLPVMVLFYGVFGTMGRMVAQRVGPSSAGLALGIVLAWSVAASTPLFVASM